jgi:hypothetical protein
LYRPGRYFRIFLSRVGGLPDRVSGTVAV